jgi:hypothetical protein
MEKKNQNKKFQELVSKMETLKETDKGQLKGGFTSVKANLPSAIQPGADTNGAAGCTCSGSGSNTNNAVGCSCTD